MIPLRSLKDSSMSKLARLSLNGCQKRFQSSAKTVDVPTLHSFGKYAYYDSIVEIAHLNMVRSDAYYIARQRQMREPVDTKTEITKVNKESKSMVFDPKSAKAGPTYHQVFGGSSKTATKSSRRDVSYRDKRKVIGGISVPSRPIEPDNCCMSGCINCVWELFNEDLEEWKQLRSEAALKLNLQKNHKGLGENGEIEKWPHNWEMPPKILDPAFIHTDLQAGAKAYNSDKNMEEIQGMPVGLQVFAMFEKKKKLEKKKRGLASPEEVESVSRSENKLRELAKRRQAAANAGTTL